MKNYLRWNFFSNPKWFRLSKIFYSFFWMYIIRLLNRPKPLLVLKRFKILNSIKLIRKHNSNWRYRVKGSLQITFLGKKSYTIYTLQIINNYFKFAILNKNINFLRKHSCQKLVVSINFIIVFPWKIRSMFLLPENSSCLYITDKNIWPSK